MPSKKQLDANRANAAKSTGPRSPEGKLRSAANGSRHLLLAETALLSSENPARFKSLARRFYHEFAPSTPAERALVDQLIVARWRLLRLCSLETAGIDHEFELLRTAGAPELPIPLRATLAYRNLSEKSRSLDTLSRLEARLQRQFDGAYDRLTRLLARRNAPPGENFGSNPFQPGLSS